MTRKDLLALGGMTAAAIFFPSRLGAKTPEPEAKTGMPADFFCSPEAASNRIHEEKMQGIRDRVLEKIKNLPAPEVVSDPPMPKVSGVNAGGGIWCQCPACLGSGFRGEDRDKCGYCRMNGYLVTTETFGMYNGEGNAEVWRAMVWHEWSQRDWKESVDGPQPWLPGMLYYIGQQHPEVYDTVVRENIYLWLEKRFDKAHAQAQYDAFVAEVERNDLLDGKFKHLYEYDDAAKKRTLLLRAGSDRPQWKADVTYTGPLV